MSDYIFYDSPTINLTYKPTRKFAIAKGFEGKGINLPKRSTLGSAGYDFEAAETVIIPSIWKLAFAMIKDGAFSYQGDTNHFMKPTLVATGIKAYMGQDEVLNIHVRSSTGIKKLLNMPNSTGIVDSDYVDNPENDGHIKVPLWNFGVRDYKVEKGERIAQGIFSKFLYVEDDTPLTNSRVGGVGSTDPQHQKERG